MRLLVNATPLPLYSRERDPIFIVHEAGWVRGPVWPSAQNLSNFGIWSPDRPPLPISYTANAGLIIAYEIFMQSDLWLIQSGEKAL